MHLVFLNQYYPPDAAPTGVMLEGLAQGLIEAGHEVTVLCAGGGYAAGGNAMPMGSAQSSSPARPAPGCAITQPRIIRIRASRFGRGSFVGKLLDYASYYLGVGWKMLTLRPRPDRIVAMTTPPYLSVLARIISKIRGCDHAHWVMDLYPDVMVAHGMLEKRGILYRILSSLAAWGFGGSRCAAVLTLGPDMAERVGSYVHEKCCFKTADARASDCSGSGILEEVRDRVSWVPLWGEYQGAGGGVEGESGDSRSVAVAEGIGGESGDSRSETLRRQRGWRDEELIVMYSGNMGLGHRFGEILEAARRCSDDSNDDALSKCPTPVHAQATAGPLGKRSLPPEDDLTKSSWRFVFFGGGKRRGEVERWIAEHPGSCVEVHDYAPAAELLTHLQSADVHVASLDAEWTGTMVPSKVQGIFTAGRPVIFIGSETSSIGQWVLKSGGGWVVAPDDVNALRVALDDARNPELRLARGCAARAFAEQHFDQASNVALMLAVLAGTKS